MPLMSLSLLLTSFFYKKTIFFKNELYSLGNKQSFNVRKSTVSKLQEEKKSKKSLVLYQLGLVDTNKYIAGPI